MAARRDRGRRPRAEAIARRQEIVVRRGATPVAKLVAYHPAQAPRVPGRLKGEIELAPDFDATPPEFADHMA